MTNTLSNFKNIHKGESVIVCGCGVSLNKIKSNYKNFITIGVNDVPALFTPTYLVVTDHPIRFNQNRRNLITESSTKALFTCVKGWNNKKTIIFELGNRRLSNLDSDNKVDYCLNSPYVAVCIAYKMGFSKIGLIGVDFTPHHFYIKDGDHPLSQMNKLKQVNEGYRVLKLQLNKRNVDFYNLSQDSKIDSLPKISIEKFKSL
tara:strand:+ start:28477 stop:29085 length:609 start_codon:yes stop_codon:yes gene_type:complete